MDFAFSEEQQALRAAAREFLAERVPLPTVARLADSQAGWDQAVWDSLVQLGWLDGDLGLAEHAVLLEEAGYALLPAPYFSTVLKAPAEENVIATVFYPKTGDTAPAQFKLGGDAKTPTVSFTASGKTITYTFAAEKISRSAP